MSTIEDKAVITPDKLLEILASGEWVVPAVLGYDAVVKAAASAGLITIERRLPGGKTDVLSVNALEGAVTVEAGPDRIHVLQRGVRREQVKKSEGGGWRQIAHDFVKIRLVHLPTWEVRDRERVECDARRRQEQDENIRKDVRERDERRRLDAEAEQAGIIRHIGRVKDTMVGAKILDIVPVEDGVRIVCDNGRSIVAKLETDVAIGTGLGIARWYGDCELTLDDEANG